MIKLRNLLPEQFRSQDLNIPKDPAYKVIIINEKSTLQSVLLEVKNVNPEQQAIIFASEFIGEFPDNIATPYKAKVNEMNNLISIYEELFKQNILQDPKFKVIGIADKDPASRMIPGTLSGKPDPEWNVGDPDAQLEVDRSVLGAHPKNKHINSANYGPDLKYEVDGKTKIVVGQVQPNNENSIAWQKKFGQDANENLASNRAGIMAAQIQTMIPGADIEVTIKTMQDKKSVRFSMMGDRPVTPVKTKPIIDLSNVMKWNTSVFTPGALNKNGMPTEQELERAVADNVAGQFNPGSLQFQKAAQQAGYDLTALHGLPKGWSKIDYNMIDRLVKFFKVKTREDVYKIISNSSGTAS